VLVSDINMPGMDGLELIDYVLKEGRVRAGVVVLTNRWDHGDIRDNLSQRGVHVLPKPFSPSKLSELIESLATASRVPAVAAEPDADIRGS
jgi:CheY-like chemotaxis protein